MENRYDIIRYRCCDADSWFNIQGGYYIMTVELIEKQIVDLTGSILKPKPIKCTRCGKCCVVLNWNTGIWEQCLNLRTIGTSGKTFCRFYRKRIGLNVKYGFRCGYRKDYPWDIPGCPYNTGKPIHPAYKESDK